MHYGLDVIVFVPNHVDKSLQYSRGPSTHLTETQTIIPRHTIVHHICTPLYTHGQNNLNQVPQLLPLTLVSSKHIAMKPDQKDKT